MHNSINFLLNSANIVFLSSPVLRCSRLVPRPIEIVEYVQQQCRCLCGKCVRGQWPSDIVPTQDLSVGLQSLLAWLGNYGHLSYGKQQELLKELGDIEIGVGTLQATNRRVADAIIQPIDKLWRWARGQAHVQVDETPWTVNGVKEWLWVAGAESFCLFHAAGTRSRDELKAMLGDDFDGVLSSDDFSVYNGYDSTELSSLTQKAVFGSLFEVLTRRSSGIAVARALRRYCL